MKESGLSVASHHEWNISTKASVVPVPANPPNWRSSICGIITSSTQFNTIPLNAFANIGVSEIGRMSFSSEPGGCFFGTGTTVAVFFPKIRKLAFSERAI